MYRCRRCSQFLELEENLGWSQGVALRAVTIRKSEHGWKLVVKGVRVGGAAVVSFTEGGLLEETLQNFYDAVRTGSLYWHRDKFPTN